MSIILYDYFRSTASYRVRIALALKDLAYDRHEVHLVNNGGEQNSAAYQKLNPQSLVPSIVTSHGVITQSLAIIEYLEAVYPEPLLLPLDVFDKAKVQSLAQLIACDVHPLNNLRVLNQLRSQFSADEVAITTWYHHWLKLGLDAFEASLAELPRDIDVCFGNSVTLADVCLIPCVYNALRYNFPLDNYPIIQRINSYCLSLPAFQQAVP